MAKIVLFLFPALIAVIIDLWSKAWVFDFLSEKNSVVLMEDFLYLTKALNPGVAFGMFQTNYDILLYLIPIIIIGLPLYVFVNRKMPLIQLFLFGLVFGGAMGNYYDRVFIGKVRDFIDVKLFSYDYPIFNLADAFISCSVFLLLILSSFEKPNLNKKS